MTMDETTDRIKELAAKELGCEVSELIHCDTWSSGLVCSCGKQDLCIMYQAPNGNTVTITCWAHGGMDAGFIKESGNESK